MKFDDLLGGGSDVATHPRRFLTNRLRTPNCEPFGWSGRSISGFPCPQTMPADTDRELGGDLSDGNNRGIEAGDGERDLPEDRSEGVTIMFSELDAYLKDPDKLERQNWLS
ncbi:hypothetical protein [Bradyrhizobium sp. HKCCYLRH1062]|uniref:hypothetical protein n=1 Tax=unclassified Bradyrhizobium TaxID=2631580 RepID=UPI003EBAB74B